MATEPGMTPRGATDFPPPDQWPCNTPVPEGVNPPPILVAFLYRLLRDGAQAPGDVEQIALTVRGAEDTPVTYYNRHMEAYARSLAMHLAPLAPAVEPPPPDGPPAPMAPT